MGYSGGRPKAGGSVGQGAATGQVTSLALS